MDKEGSLEIREMTEEDMEEVRRRADLVWRSTLRPSKNEPRWEKVVRYDAPLYRPISLGNMTQYEVGAFYTKLGRLFVAIEGKGAYTFERWVHRGYAEEKLGLLPGDAGNVADWINAQLELEGLEQGRYGYPELLRENQKNPSFASFNGA